MAKWAQGIYEVKNSAKYMGLKKPKYRSSWELAFCTFCDNNNSILKWASESIQIPYRNPLTGKQTIYIPDFFIQYITKNNQVISELIEIKPKKQTFIESKRVSARDRAAIVINHAKWEQANHWCKKMGITFRVLTEQELFHTGKK